MVSKMHQKIMAVSMSNFLCIIIRARRIEMEYEKVVSHEMDEKKKSKQPAYLIISFPKRTQKVSGLS